MRLLSRSLVESASEICTTGLHDRGIPRGHRLLELMEFSHGGLDVGIEWHSRTPSSVRECRALLAALGVKRSGGHGDQRLIALGYLAVIPDALSRIQLQDNSPTFVWVCGGVSGSIRTPGSRVTRCSRPSHCGGAIPAHADCSASAGTMLVRAAGLLAGHGRHRVAQRGALLQGGDSCRIWTRPGGGPGTG
jgi:hypothetical protein